MLYLPDMLTLSRSSVTSILSAFSAEARKFLRTTNQYSQEQEYTQISVWATMLQLSIPVRLRCIRYAARTELPKPSRSGCI